VLGFSLLATLMTGVLFGLAPAAHALGLDPMRAIREGAGGGARRRARSVLVSAQFSVSLVLLVTAALFARAVAASAAADPGFDAAGVAVAGIDLEPHAYDDAGRRAWYDALLLRLRARQDVETAGLAKVVPLGFSRSSTFVVVAGSDRAPPDRPANVQYNVIDAGYLDALRLRVVAGRTFAAADDAGAVRVALVNETFARRFWPEPAAAVGGTVREDGAAIRVVGVVADSRYRALREPATPQLYLPFSQRGGAATSVFVRGRGDAGGALAALRHEVAALDRDVPLIDAQPLDDVIALSVFPQRLAAMLIGIFGALGLALAAVGIYGVVAYTVARSTREIGIRMALGAGRGRVHRSVTLHALRLAGIGAAVGCAIALPGARVLAGLLHGVSPSDPVAFGGVALLLAAVALLAAWLPARRAASIEPSVALRQE
jgi:predicted permease